MSDSESIVEFRCPRDRRTMFGKILSPVPHIEMTIAAYVGDIEFACPECKRVLGKRGLIVQRVLHRYRLDGTHLETTHVGQR